MSRPNIKRPNSVILPVHTDSFVPNARPVTTSRSLSQIDSLKDGFKIDNIKPINKWTYLDNSNKSSSCLPDRAINININESSSDKVNFHLQKSDSALTVKENIRALTCELNSTKALSNKVENDAKDEMKFQAFSAKIGQFQDPSETNRVETNEIIRQKNIDETDARKIINSREDNSKRPSLKSLESVHSNQENNEEVKIQLRRDNEETSENENCLDDAWWSYVERPLLPLKPLQKHKSRSCTNLVQAIKGFSKKKTSANRFSSPESTLFENKDLCTSQANISNMPVRKISAESTGQNLPRFSNESFTMKREHQSLEHYLWYHLVEAKEASKRLMNMHQNGAFLIRPASNPTNEILHTLCVVILGHVYNFHIKNLKDGRITLSTKKEQKETFPSLLDMIKYHQTVPITINLAGQVVHVHLLITPPK